MLTRRLSDGSIPCSTGTAVSHNGDNKGEGVAGRSLPPLKGGSSCCQQSPMFIVVHLILKRAVCSGMHTMSTTVQCKGGAKRPSVALLKSDLTIVVPISTGSWPELCRSTPGPSHTTLGSPTTRPSIFQFPSVLRLLSLFNKCPSIIFISSATAGCGQRLSLLCCYDWSRPQAAH